MAYYETEPTGGLSNNNQSTEKSIKSCYAVVYELDNRKWVVAGEGGWSEVHLCEDASDSSHRILAWTVKSQQVLMNCNVTSECTYKEKSKNFHSFSDENGNRYGLGFHKSESGLKQAAHFLKSVIAVIHLYKDRLNEYEVVPPSLPYISSASNVTLPSNSPLHLPQHDAQQQSKRSAPPPMYASLNGSTKTHHHQPSPSPSPQPKNGVSRNEFQPTYHLNKTQQQSLPTAPVKQTLGNLRILPPKPQKHASGDDKIKNPTAVEHKVQVTHDKETGLYSGLPKEWRDHLNKQFGVEPKQLPGVQLDLYESKIPKVLVMLRNALEEADGYQQVGIFRLAPNASDNKAVKEKIDKGQLNDSEEKVDVNVYANLIKVWFRDLPTPLLNCVNPDMIEHVNNTQDAENVIDAFPEPHKSIFLWLCDMCVAIAKHKKTNKMSAQNVAIVVGPNLFNTDKFENPMKAMTYSGNVVEFLKHSILWRELMTS
eukprot:195106_1